MLHPPSWTPTGAARTCEEHVQLSHLGLEVDGGAEEVESGGVLLHRQVHQPQIVQDLPVEGSQVVCPLQAADGLQKIRDKPPVTQPTQNRPQEESCSCAALATDERRKESRYLLLCISSSRRSTSRCCSRAGGSRGRRWLPRGTWRGQRQSPRGPASCCQPPRSPAGETSDQRFPKYSKKTTGQN